MLLKKQSKQLQLLQQPAQQLQQNQRKQLPQQQPIMSPKLGLPLCQPSTSGGIMISGKQLQNAQQYQRQQSINKSQAQPIPTRMYPNGNSLTMADANQITIVKIPPGATHDLNIL